MASPNAGGIREVDLPRGGRARTIGRSEAGLPHLAPDASPPGPPTTRVLDARLARRRTPTPRSTVDGDVVLGHAACRVSALN